MSKESDLKTAVAALVLILVGVLLLVLGANLDPGWRAALAYNVGSFIVASVVLALIWQFWQVRGFLDDMFKEARIADTLKRARITHFFTSFHDPVPWDDLFAGSKSLDILFAYAHTWRNTHRTRLERLLRSSDAKLNIVLPDPDNEVVMAEMALRFGYTPDGLKERVHEAKQYFEELATRGEGRVSIYYLARSLTFTFYRFSSGAVFTTYRHKPGRGAVITLVCEREGELYGWIRDEWYGIVEEAVRSGAARLAFQSQTA